VSGCGDNLAIDDADAIEQAKQWFSYLPGNWRDIPPATAGEAALVGLTRSVLPEKEAAGYDMHRLLDGLVDADSFFEVKPLWAPEVIIGFGRLDGHAVGIVANNPMQKGGVLFVDSADTCARFIWLCDAFNVPLLFLADVPGFMIGTEVERQGIIRHGAKMISAVSEATVPKLSVIVRKAYGAGLYAMAGPAFDPDGCIALPSASIAVMGPQAAINAVFYNQLQAIEDPNERARRTDELRREYAEDIDILHLASELVVDAVIQPEDLRTELAKRFALAVTKSRDWPRKRNPITPA
jgi:acetyl-CoA carboxylase carboxyltransferase component